MIAINFNNTYELLSRSLDFSKTLFQSVDQMGEAILLKIQITPLGDPFLPNVYNLSFGPPLEDGTVDDQIKIHYKDKSKMFSTVILFTLTFLKENPTATIGLDGSNDARAYLYHRMFLTNRDYFKEYFVSFGVDWFVRLLRNNSVETDVNGRPLFKPQTQYFSYQRSTQDLYLYYMYRLNS